MAYVIGDGCIKCGSCAANCPVSAISEGDDKFVIDADTWRHLCGGLPGRGDQRRVILPPTNKRRDERLFPGERLARTNRIFMPV